jgi:flagellar hook-length control protein FliK
MNSALLKILSLPVNCKGSGITKSLNSKGGKGSFLSIVQKSLASIQGQSFPKNTVFSGTNLNIKKEYCNYFDSLKEKLLAKGGSLDNLSLKATDRPLAEKFLCQCGFTKKEAQDFLDNLTEGNQRKEIDLSEFFSNLSELGDIAENDNYQTCTLESSDVPYIESLLRDIDITPKEIQNAFDASSVEGGGLDLVRCVVELKKIGSKIPNQENKLKLNQFVEKIEKIIEGSAAPKDLNPENQLTAEKIPAYESPSIIKKIITQTDNEKHLHALNKDFETTGQRIAETSEKSTEFTQELNATIDQIVDRAVVGKKENEIKSAFSNFSKLELVNQHSDKQTHRRTDIPEKENLFSKPENKAKQTGFIADADAEQGLKGKTEKESEVKFISDPDAGRELKDNPKENKYVIRSEAKTIDTARYDNFVSRFSEVTNEVKENSGPAKGVAPSYLIDQVGKQISASMLNGDKTIKFQLKPPELGTLKIEMDVNDNVLKLGVITENSTTKEILLSNIQELRDSLIDQGVKLEKLDVQINYNFEQSLANSKGGTREQRRSAQGRDGTFSMSAGNAEHSISGIPAEKTSNNLLDLVA